MNGDRDPGDGEARRSTDRRSGASWRVPMVLLALVAGVLISGTWVVGRTMSEPGGGQTAGPSGGGIDGDEVGSSGRIRGFACTYVGDRDEDDGYCGRAAEDFARRAEVSPAQRESAQATVQAVERALPSEWPSMCRANVAACAGWGPDAPRGSTDLEVFRAAFRRAGFPGAEVRIAGGDDPAPRGTVLYAVPVGENCVVGWIRGVAGVGSNGIEGPLPNGRCLE
jgi:hypothetical protein